VLDSLSSPRSTRNYKFAMEQFITWYCSEPRLALNRTVVLRFRLHLESLGLPAGTINHRLAAVRQLACEAADSGLLSPALAAGIRRVKGVKQLGCRAGTVCVEGPFVVSGFLAIFFCRCRDSIGIQRLQWGLEQHNVS
jgi:hypothetical protein